MIEFFEKTWVLWWIFASFAILRWNYAVCSSREIDRELDNEDAQTYPTRQAQ